ncbi:deoxycytidine triphosphate deaminase [Pseudomonas sp. C1C7]|uniref:dCTP deaminase domain-containing protein n=1 Tax=Pseudomonas sp. C1C7 TaxID=2735272 RepID=UPI00158680E7|nr:deoxycytidine triphosphate deaminase [Pseudomonas sp. C1C7]NUT75045.1 deoxycytidine triphosphate deaminase [Pseudomonas sp. C1C7]
MAFWSGEKLAQHLPSLITPYISSNIDCASYKLSVGEQAFVTSEQLESTEPAAKLVTVLGTAPDNMLRIAPGQFAFILTLENIKVPINALALISMRAKYKFQGLINVSGFHVDPGWDGKLLFSIYNAGPQAVVVEKGEAMFLIVYSDLDRDSNEIYRGGSQGQNSIKPDLLTKLTSQTFSPQVLKRQLDQVHEKLSNLQLRMGITASVATAIGIVLGIIVAGFALLPSWTGVVIARTLDSAGYEIRQKPDAKETSEKNPLLYSPRTQNSVEKKSSTESSSYGREL